MVLLALLACSLAAIDGAAQAVIEMQEGWITLDDSQPESGRFSRPRICPVDTSYVAYEFHDNGMSSLYIYHRPSRTEYPVTPTLPPDIDSVPDFVLVGPLPDSMADEDSLSETVRKDSLHKDTMMSNQDISCGDLSWCPVAIDDRIWAAYLAGSGRVFGLYLYELTSQTSFLLWNSDDPDSGEPATAWGTPQWSPDGTCLAFTIVKDGRSDIFVIRNLLPYLEDTLKFAEEIPIRRLDDGEANRFQPVWCPVAGSGLLSYTEQDSGGARLRIGIFDILENRSYELPAADSTRDCLGPSWSSGGRRLAFYHHRDIRELLDIEANRYPAYCDLGITSVNYAADSLIIRDETPPDTSSARAFTLMPNTDPFSGPEWLPGGRHLLISAPDDIQRVRFHVVSIPDFIAPESEIDYVLRGFGGERFAFPRDIDIYNRDIAFIYGPRTGPKLVMGQLVPNLILVSATDNLKFDYERQLLWDDFARGKDRDGTFFGAVWDFLWSPIAGPDIGINKGIVPVAGGLIALAIVLSGDEGGGIAPVPQRDWTPPEFPTSKRGNPGLRVEFGL